MTRTERPPDPQRLSVDAELDSCPQCGYRSGFHVAFRRRERDLAVFLVCPGCAARFAVGEWIVPTGELRPFDPSLDAGP